jgi:hypothetical protein
MMLHRLSKDDAAVDVFDDVVVPQGGRSSRVTYLYLETPKIYQHPMSICQSVKLDIRRHEVSLRSIALGQGARLAGTVNLRAGMALTQ